MSGPLTTSVNDRAASTAVGPWRSLAGTTYLTESADTHLPAASLYAGLAVFPGWRPEPSLTRHQSAARPKMMHRRASRKSRCCGRAVHPVHIDLALTASKLAP